MDSGYIAPGENHTQALEDDYDVRQALTPEQVVGLMDQLLCHEVSCDIAVTGNILAYTIADGLAHGASPFTNTLYLDLPGQVALASSEDDGRCPVRSRTERVAFDQSCSPIILPGSRQDLRLCPYSHSDGILL